MPSWVLAACVNDLGSFNKYPFVLDVSQTMGHVIDETKNNNNNTSRHNVHQKIDRIGLFQFSCVAYLRLSSLFRFETIGRVARL